MKQWLKRITGVADIEAAARSAELKIIEHEKHLAQLKADQEAAEKSAAEAKHNLEIAKLSPKERATHKGEPYVAVLDTKVNPDNIRNGFFELDWNEFFIKELISNGYGTEADPEEEIVDRWFRDIVYQMLDEEGIDTSRGAGFINVNRLPGGKSAVS
jgi:hypothetical protein